MIPRSLPVWLLAAATSLQLVIAQTSTKCNPLQGTCPADAALGGSTTIDFTSGQSDRFSESGSPEPTYDSSGVHLVVAQSGNSPTLTSNFYMMFGHVEVTMKAATGVGIVSSMVLQSDDLDEIDFEWLGADGNQVQSNYFGKGQTTSYNRGAFHSNPGNQQDYHTYTVDWTAGQVVWQIDGTTVRALTPSSAESGQYPQTPMQLKIGTWSGGDPSNPPGTIQWAGGPTQYSQGPFTMYVKSVKAVDYSTGTEYTYSDNSGSWQSIRSNGGSVNSDGNDAVSSAAAAAPSVTEVSSGAPSPFGGTHRESSTFVTPSEWPWVASSTLATSVQTSIPGVPSGWTVTGSGHVVPPSAAPSTPPPSQPSSSQSVSPPPSSSAPAGSSPKYITTVVYNQQGFPTTVTEPAAWVTAVKSYDQQGFPIQPTGSAANKQTDLKNLKDFDDLKAAGLEAVQGPKNGAALPPSSQNAPPADPTSLLASISNSFASATSEEPTTLSTLTSSGTESSSATDSASITASASLTSSSATTSTTTTYNPPTSLNATPMPIPTVMGGGASELSARTWSVGLGAGVLALFLI